MPGVVKVDLGQASGLAELMEAARDGVGMRKHREIRSPADVALRALSGPHACALGVEEGPFDRVGGERARRGVGGSGFLVAAEAV